MIQQDINKIAFDLWETHKDDFFSVPEDNPLEDLDVYKRQDLMWLLNIRGADVECNPVALSYAYLTQDECHFFLQDGEVTDVLKMCIRDRSSLPLACAMTAH